MLTLSIGMRVSPEPGAIELLRRYNVALNYAVNKILSLNLKTIKDVHRVLYRELREWFGLSSRIAIECHRDARQMQGLGGIILRKANVLGLRGLACHCTRDQAIESKGAILRS